MESFTTRILGFCLLQMVIAWAVWNLGLEYDYYGNRLGERTSLQLLQYYPPRILFIPRLAWKRFLDRDALPLIPPWPKRVWHRIIPLPPTILGRSTRGMALTRGAIM